MSATNSIYRGHGADQIVKKGSSHDKKNRDSAIQPRFL